MRELVTQERDFLARVIEHNIRALAPVDTGYGRDHTFVEVDAEAQIKISMPTYMFYQDKGTKPRIMWELEGKTIPMMGGFRRASNVGGHRITHRESSGRIAKGNKPIRWRNPGLPAKEFIRRGINNSRGAIVMITMDKDLSSA